MQKENTIYSAIELLNKLEAGMPKDDISKIGCQKISSEQTVGEFVDMLIGLKEAKFEEGMVILTYPRRSPDAIG